MLLAILRDGRIATEDCGFGALDNGDGVVNLRGTPEILDRKVFSRKIRGNSSRRISLRKA
jgi:hypothetical protein